MKKDENGNIVMKENFFLRYFWCANLIYFIGAILFKSNKPFKPSYPNNRCTRFWGFALAPIIWAVALLVFCFNLVVMIFYVFIVACFIVLLFPFGFAIVWPWNEEKYIRREFEEGKRNSFEKKNDESPFSIHPYRRYGLNNEKKFPALWWFWLPALLIWPFKGEYFYVAKRVIKNIFFFLVSTKGIVFLCIVSFILLVVWFFRSKYRKLLWEKILVLKKKTCLPIVVIKKEK